MTDERKEQFTPGPWRKTMEESNPFKFFVCGKAGLIAIVGADGDIYTRHNAALISAAPEMYNSTKDLAECLAEVITAIINGDDLPDALIAMAQEEVEKAANILKKARGEE